MRKTGLERSGLSAGSPLTDRSVSGPDPTSRIGATRRRLFLLRSNGRRLRNSEVLRSGQRHMLRARDQDSRHPEDAAAQAGLQKSVGGPVTGNLEGPGGARLPWAESVTLAAEWRGSAVHEAAVRCRHHQLAWPRAKELKVLRDFGQYPVADRHRPHGGLHVGLPEGSDSGVGEQRIYMRPEVGRVGVDRIRPQVNQRGQELVLGIVADPDRTTARIDVGATEHVRLDSGDEPLGIDLSLVGFAVSGAVRTDPDGQPAFAVTVPGGAAPVRREPEISYACHGHTQVRSGHYRASQAWMSAQS